MRLLTALSRMNISRFFHGSESYHSYAFFFFFLFKLKFIKLTYNNRGDTIYPYVLWELNSLIFTHDSRNADFFFFTFSYNSSFPWYFDPPSSKSDRIGKLSQNFILSEIRFSDILMLSCPMWRYSRAWVLTGFHLTGISCDTSGVGLLKMNRSFCWTNTNDFNEPILNESFNSPGFCKVVPKTRDNIHHFVVLLAQWNVLEQLFTDREQILKFIRVRYAVIVVRIAKYHTERCVPFVCEIIIIHGRGLFCEIITHRSVSCMIEPGVAVHL